MSKEDFNEVTTDTFLTNFAKLSIPKYVALQIFLIQGNYI